jgi:hypothetical protein
MEGFSGWFGLQQAMARESASRPIVPSSSTSSGRTATFSSISDLIGGLGGMFGWSVASIPAAAASSSSSFSFSPAAAAASSIKRGLPTLTEKPRINFKIIYEVETEDFSPSDIAYGFMFVSHGIIYKDGVCPISLDRINQLVPELLNNNFGLFDPVRDSCILVESIFVVEQYINGFSKILPHIIRNQYERTDIKNKGTTSYRKSNIPKEDFKIEIINLEREVKRGTMTPILGEDSVLSPIKESALGPTPAPAMGPTPAPAWGSESNRDMMASFFNFFRKDPKIFREYLPLIYLNFSDIKILNGLIIIQYNKLINKIIRIGHNISNANNLAPILYTPSVYGRPPSKDIFIGDVINRVFSYFKDDFIGDIPRDRPDLYPKFLFYSHSCRTAKSPPIPLEYKPVLFRETPKYNDIDMEARLFVDPKGSNTAPLLLRRRRNQHMRDVSIEDDYIKTLIIKKEIDAIESILRYRLFEGDDASVLYKGKNITLRNLKNILHALKNRYRREIASYNKTFGYKSPKGKRTLRKRRHTLKKY